MRNLLNPKWIFVINTLPIVILFVLYLSQFNIIKSQLDFESIEYWKNFGLALGGLGVLNLIYGVYLTIKRQKVSFIYGIVALLCYIPFIYLFGTHSEKIIPFSIPRWMAPPNMILYVGTFLMPTLVYSIFILVSRATPKNKEHKAWISAAITVLIPITWYLFAQIILPLWQPVNNNFEIHAMLIFIIVGTLAFLFFLIRSIFILATKKKNLYKKYQLIWKIPISIILPLIGLAVNNGHLFNEFGVPNSGIFGDFNNYWFYVLAVVNGLFICLPNSENLTYRIFVFIGRCITFAYTFYFFLVFLPFLPISVVAIIAIGTGFLMLTPLALFVIHVNELSNDFQFLTQHISKNTFYAIIVASVLVIPAVLTGGYLKDKNVLNKTLDYLYSPNYSEEYSINEGSLRKTLAVIKGHKNRNNDFIFGNQTPYLSSFYNWVVLDNLTLSDAKINHIEKVFFNKFSFSEQRETIRNKDVKISNITSKSTFDKKQNAWKSWINLEITNTSPNSWFSEYATTLDLPDGCWISNYYLYVGDKKEMGILAEKKAAMWVFSQIRNANRDPGILYYLTGNKVAFKVFPFAKNEVRKTGIELIHKEPITLTIDKNEVHLGSEITTGSNSSFENENVIYVSAKEKAKLHRVQRKPYFHFLLDVSEGNQGDTKVFIERLEHIMETNKDMTKNAKISFVNTYVSSVSVQENWKDIYQKKQRKGGFFLDRAIKKALIEGYKRSDQNYPVIVVVTDSILEAVLDKDFSDLKMTFPENDLFFHLGEIGELKAHSLVSNPLNPLLDSLKFPSENTVFEYKLENNTSAFLPDNHEPSIVLKKDVFNIAEQEILHEEWSTGLLMQGKWNSLILHPETSDAEWLNLVKHSFISKIMSPVTSYLVVENEAQKAMLYKKQDQVLNGNKQLDAGEEAGRMSEPGLMVIGLSLLLILGYKKRRSLV